MGKVRTKTQAVETDDRVKMYVRIKPSLRRDFKTIMGHIGVTMEDRVSQLISEDIRRFRERLSEVGVN